MQDYEIKDLYEFVKDMPLESGKLVFTDDSVAVFNKFKADIAEIDISNIKSDNLLDMIEQVVSIFLFDNLEYDYNEYEWIDPEVLK